MKGRISAARLPIERALGLLLDGVDPVPPQVVPADAAPGRIVAADIVVPHPLPARSIALRDGWAVEAAMVAGASPYNPVLPARPPSWVEAGEALPAECDAVLPPEAIEGREIVADVAGLEGVCPAGGDLACGARLVAAGERLRPLHRIGLAAAGLDSVSIRLPRLRLIATGKRLPADDGLSPTLAALVEAEGGTISETLHLPDDEAAIAAAIQGEGIDAVLVLGGSGFGRSDRSFAALARAGEVRGQAVALRPGETAAFGTCANWPVLLVPGRPEAALAVMLVLGRPLVAALAGAVPQLNGRAHLSRKIASIIGLTELVFGRRRGEAVEPLGGAELPLAHLLEADCACVVPPESEGYPEGAQIEIMLL